MGRKDKKKDEDISDGDSVLGALGLALPDVGKPGPAKPAPAPAPVPQGGLGLSFDIGASAPAPRPAVAPRQAPAAKPVAQDSLMLSFGEPAPRAAPVARPAVAAPAPAPVAARPVVAAPAPAPVQPAAKPVPARKLAALPALPKFVAPEEIKIEMGFDAPPVEGKGKITQITWNLKATDQASNIISRQSRALNMSPLMAEALDQAKSLRDAIKQHKQETAPAPQPAPQPRAAPAPAPRVAPAAVAQPAPQPRAAPAPTPRAAPAPQPAPRPVTKPAPRPAPAPEPLPALEAIPEQEPQPQARSRPQIQIEPAAANVPDRDIIAVPVKTMGGDTLQAQQPIEKHAWQEAKSVMAPSATSRFTAVSQQDFNQSPAASAVRQQPRAAPARQAPAPEPVYEETQTAAQARGGRICAKCGGSNFREDDDKNKPLSFTPPFLYAKKFTCKNCGTLFGAEAQEATTSATQPAARPVRPSQVAQQQAPTQPRRVVQTSWEETSQQVRPSAVAAKEEAAPVYGTAGYEEPVAGEEHKDGVRAVCPNCGGTAFNVVSDKTRPISFGMGGMGAVYAKVKQCRKCGAKFD
jgi:hypothetical protein